MRKVDGLQNRILLDPVLGRGYPLDVLQDTTWLGDWTNVVRDGDMETIATPIDWIGVNYYNPTRVAPADPDFVPAGPHAGLRGVALQPPRGELTGFGWEQNADAFTELLVRLSRDVDGIPLVVTENGSAFPDVVDPMGRVADVERTKYLVDHVRAVHRAISAGRDIRGYSGVVAAGQLRVGRRVLAAVRHRARRLRDADPHAQDQRAVVRQGGPGQRTGRHGWPVTDIARNRRPGPRSRRSPAWPGCRSSTVSRVINGEPYVSDKAREAVHRAIG